MQEPGQRCFKVALPCKSPEAHEFFRCAGATRCNKHPGAFGAGLMSALARGISRHPGTVSPCLPLRCSYYKHPDTFLADVRLVFTNARAYNKPGSDVFVMANTLQVWRGERMCRCKATQGCPAASAKALLGARCTRSAPDDRRAGLSSHD